MESKHEPVTPKIVSLPASTWQKVADYRFNERIAAEAEAIRRLIEKGLRAT